MEIVRCEIGEGVLLRVEEIKSKVYEGFLISAIVDGEVEHLRKAGSLEEAMEYFLDKILNLLGL